MKERLKPGVARHWLFAIAGLVWAGVGIMLLRLAYLWLAELDTPTALALGAVGLGLGAAGGFTLFSRIARKNISRIGEAPDIACVFSFQAWEGYLVMTFMIGLGIMLRHSPIPKSVLAVLYTGVGVSLALASVRYFVALTDRTD